MFFVQHRLAQLQWSRDDLAAAGGPAPSTLYKAHRGGRDLAERTLARLEVALGWQPGSGLRIVAGASPVMRVSEQLETASGRIDAELSRGRQAGVRATAAELRDFLMTVAQRLDGFYSGRCESAQEAADVGPC